MNNVPTICPGRCNAAWRAAERRYETTGTDHDLEPRDGQPVWCPPCTTAIRGALADMPELAVALREEVESGISAAISEFVSGSKNRPVHDHEAASFLLDEATEWIAEWEDTVRQELGLKPRQHTVNRLITIGGAVEMLLTHLDWHLAGRCGTEWDHLYTADFTGADISCDFGTDLLRYHRQAQVLTGNQDPEPVRIVGVICPGCGYKALEHEVEPETARKMSVTRYRVDAAGQPQIGRIDADGNPIVLVVEYDEDGNEKKPPPTWPVKLTETFAMPKQGVVTGYVRCRRCRPELRMTPDQLDQWMKMLAADKETRRRATPELLAEIFGGSVPAQYRAVR